MVENERNELIPTRTLMGWRVSIDYRRLNKIVIYLEDQEKTTFTCPYVTFAFKRMPFCLFNALATFQRCMMAIFTDMVGKFVEVVMDDFSVFGSSYDDCIMLGHRVSRSGIEVDKAKVEAVEKLPPPISVKGVRSFLGHAGLLEKDVTFNFDDACLKAFEELKKKLVAAPIIVAPDWSLPFELMCDGSDHAIGALLGQRKDKEFDVKIRDRKGTKNQVADHLSRLENHDHVEEGGDIKELLPPEIESEAKKRFLHDVNFYYWDEPYLFKRCADKLMRRYIPKKEVELVLYDCHALPYGGHHGSDRTAAKILQSGFFWPTLFKDAHALVKKCDQCHRTGTITKRHLNNILEVEIFYAWGIDFMGPFPLSRENKYILLAVDYVLKWVEAITLPTNDAMVVASFVKKNIFLEVWDSTCLD
ncbi:PREDICTED: uncharacterized protein LOC109229949 [Nicotiana attenuata]|uniref:uncharacterized protein LOC109229949 n=1 Tax=Nicotiana attenuata TaxID=49451 RepID=UPI000904B3FE|nr:PREDICTED: uncharacterized protein LOC109229949 [Nicotiana attenuata]